MPKKRAFVSFDYDHDETLKTFLIGQSRHPDTPFELADWSVKEHLLGDWQAKARAKIRCVDVVIVLCGQHTHRASGVSEELRMAREERKPYFLLKGYSDVMCTKPTNALVDDKLYRWTWDNLKALVNGAR